jgi:hypothetical protein
MKGRFLDATCSYFVKCRYGVFHSGARKKSAKGIFNGTRYYEVKTSSQEALEKAGIGNFRFQDLRHCFVSDLVQRKVGLYVVQKLQGRGYHFPVVIAALQAHFFSTLHS